MAILHRTPSQLRRSHGIQFESDIDDLGKYQIAAIYDREVKQFWLTRHTQSPDPGTEVQVDSAVTSEQAIAAVVRQLGTEVWRKPAFSWVTKYPSRPSFAHSSPS